MPGSCAEERLELELTKEHTLPLRCRSFEAGTSCVDELRIVRSMMVRRISIGFHGAERSITTIETLRMCDLL
jgi:hypothetical protein